MHRFVGRAPPLEHIERLKSVIEFMFGLGSPPRAQDKKFRAYLIAMLEVINGDVRKEAVEH